MPKRNYSAAYIKYGFIAIEHNGEALPQYVVCMKILEFSYETKLTPTLS